MVVKPKVSMGVFDVDGVTSLDHIELGQFQWDMTKYFPEGGFTPPTTFYYVKNTDQVSFYVSFTISDLPPDSDINIYVYIKRGDQAAFTLLGVCAGSTPVENIYNKPIESNLVNPDPETQYAVWYVQIELNSAPFGTYTPTLTVNAYDSPSG
jgi:hypothetical protein